MRITPAGVPVGGVGDRGVFVGRVRLCDGGNATTGGNRVYYQSLLNQIRSRALDGSDDRLEMDSGATTIVAGGGALAKFLSGSGVVASWGLRLAAGAVLHMTEEGDLLVTLSYDEGKGLAMYRKGESTPAWALPDADVSILNPYPQAFALDVNCAVWRDRIGRLFTRGLPPPAQVGPAVDPLLTVNPLTGDVWVGYHTNDDRFLLHPIADASRGYIVATGDTYGTTAAGGFVGYSLTPSESEMVTMLVDWSAPVVSLEAPAPVALAPNVPSFHVCGTWLADASAPGNLAIGSPTYEVPDQAVVIAGELKNDAIPEERRGGLLVYLDRDDDSVRATIARLMSVAAERRLPLCVYDDRAVGRFTLVKDACGAAPWIWLPQWYLDIGESPDAFVARVKALAQTYGGHPILPVIRAYTAWRLPPGETDISKGYDAIPEAQVVAALNELVTQNALKIPGFLGPLFFAWDRLDGAKNRPMVKAAVNVWMKVPATADNGRAFADQFFVEQPAPVRFAITVHGYTQQGQAPFRPRVDYTVEGAPGTVSVLVTLDGLVVGSSELMSGSVFSSEPITQPGEYRIGLTAVSNGHKTQTGSVRIVRVLPAPEIPGITYPTQPGSGRPEDASKVWNAAADAARKEEPNRE